MALISCPECGKEVSDRAPACIHCGYPLSSAAPYADFRPITGRSEIRRKRRISSAAVPGEAQ